MPFCPRAASAARQRARWRFNDGKINDEKINLVTPPSFHSDAEAGACGAGRSAAGSVNSQLHSLRKLLS